MSNIKAQVKMILVMCFHFSLEKMSESGQLDRIFTRWLVSTAPACAAGINSLSSELPIQPIDDTVKFIFNHEI